MGQLLPQTMLMTATTTMATKNDGHNNVAVIVYFTLWPSLSWFAADIV